MGTRLEPRRKDDENMSDGGDEHSRFAWACFHLLLGLILPGLPMLPLMKPFLHFVMSLLQYSAGCFSRCVLWKDRAVSTKN
jgi:hypothetical protein